MTTTTMPTLRGVFLVPGVSKNRRYYSPAAIGKAVDRMQARIADPDGLPIVMRTSHSAGDQSELIIGRITGATQRPDGAGEFEARMYDTAPARDIAALVQPADGAPPALKSVSISGSFLGEVKNLVVNGETCQAGDDIEIDAIDFTARPGVTGALITPNARPVESAGYRPGANRTPISESWENPMTTTAPAAQPMSPAQFDTLIARIREAASPVAPITEADLSAANVTRARAIVEADTRIRSQAAEQAAITEAAELRAMSTHDLGRRITERMTASYRLNSPGWAEDFAARGGRTLFDS